MKGIVWGRFYVHAAEKLEEVINDYLKAGIKVIKRANSKGVSHVRFSNDDYWEALGMTESARGRCVNVSYIENTIPDDFVTSFMISSILPSIMEVVPLSVCISSSTPALSSLVPSTRLFAFSPSFLSEVLPAIAAIT